MCKTTDGKELTLPQILERLEAKRAGRHPLVRTSLPAGAVVYSAHERRTARTVLDRLAKRPAATSVHSTKIRI